MTKDLSHSEPHRRTRRDHATETAEDYVEAIAEILGRQGICRLKDLAERMDMQDLRFLAPWLTCGPVCGTGELVALSLSEVGFSQMRAGVRHPGRCAENRVRVLKGCSAIKVGFRHSEFNR